MNISIWSITYQHYDEIINQSLNTCIILVGVGRIYSIQGAGGQKGEGYFSNSGGSRLCIYATACLQFRTCGYETKGILP